MYTVVQKKNPLYITTSTFCVVLTFCNLLLIEEGDPHIVGGHLAGGSAFTRAYHTRPGVSVSTECDHSLTAFSQYSIPLSHPMMSRTADHSSQLSARVRLGSAISYETPIPIGGTGSMSPNQPESTLHQLLTSISVATGNSDGLVYGVGASGAQRIRRKGLCLFLCNPISCTVCSRL